MTGISNQLLEPVTAAIFIAKDRQQRTAKQWPPIMIQPILAEILHTNNDKSNTKPIRTETTWIMMLGITGGKIIRVLY